MGRSKPLEDWDALDYEALNLFSPAAPISEAELFAGRQEQVRRLIEAVYERGRHAALYGERGVGKTSLTNIFHLIIGQNITKFLLPLRKQAGPKDTFTSLWRRIFQDINIQITKEGSSHTIPLSDLYYNGILPDDVLRELSAFPLNQSPVIIFDEYDKIEDLESRRLMSHTMKAISDTGINATVIIVGVAEDIDRLVEDHASVERNLTEIRMPRMSEIELMQILDKRILKLGMRIAGDAKWKVVTLSRGLPAYVHALGRDAVRNAIARKKLEVVEADVDQAIRDMIKLSDQSTSREYKKAIHSNKKNNLYKEVLLACAIVETDDEGRFSPAALIEPLSGILKRRVEIANFQGHLNAFCETERGSILEKRGSTRAYKYRFKEPNMQPYVLMQGIADGSIDEKSLAILSAPEQPRLSNKF